MVRFFNVWYWRSFSIYRKLILKDVCEYVLFSIWLPEEQEYLGSLVKISEIPSYIREFHSMLGYSFKIESGNTTV